MVVSSHSGEDLLVSFGGYNGRYNNDVKDHFIYLTFYLISFFNFFCHPPSSDVIFCLQVYVLKPSHKSTVQSKAIENPLPDSVGAVQNTTNATGDMEPESEAGYEGKIREIVMDNVDPRTTVCLIAVHVHFFCPVIES